MRPSSNVTNLIDQEPGGLTENELWEELRAMAPPERKPNGVTASELAEIWNCSEPTARRWLVAQEKAGKYYHEDVMQSRSNDGIMHKIRVWYKS